MLRLTKRFHTLALAALALLALTPAHAIQQLIKTATTDSVPVLVTDSTGAPVTGAGSAFTATVRRPGASAYVAGLGTVSEDGNGVYEYTATSAETTIAGSKNLLLVHLVSNTSATSFGDASAQIVLDLPGATIVSVSGNVYGNVYGDVGGKVYGTVGSVVSPVALSTGDETKIASIGLDTPGTTTLLGRFTVGRATGLDYLDAAISSRLAASAYAAPPTDYQQRGQSVTLGSTDSGNLATAAASTPAAVLAAIKADAAFVAALKRGQGRFTYNETTHAFQPLFNDGTPDGPPLTLTVATDGVITAR